MDLKSINPLEVYYQLNLLKFKKESADKLRNFLNLLNKKLVSLDLTNPIFLKQIEAFLVLISKILTLRRSHKSIWLYDVDSAISFFDFYTSTRNWINLDVEKPLDIFKLEANRTLYDLTEIYKIELAPNSILTLEEIISRFDKHFIQIHTTENEDITNIKKEKLLLLLKYSIIMLSKLISLSKSELKVSSEDIINSYDKIRNLIFRLPLFEFDIIVNYKRFIKRELILRMVEYMEFTQKNSQFSRLIENYMLSLIKNRIKSEHETSLKNELKAFFYLLFITNKFMKFDAILNNEELDRYRTIMDDIILQIIKESDLLEKGILYQTLLKTNISIGGKISLSELRNRIVEFKNQVNVNEEKKYLLSDLGGKISNSVLFIARLIAISEKKLDFGINEIKKALNVLSEVIVTN